MGIDREDPTLTDAVREVARVWWVVLVVGLVFTGFGVVMLFDVAAGATTIAIIVGAFLIFDGLVEMISGGRRGGSRAAEQAGLWHDRASRHSSACRHQP